MDWFLERGHRDITVFVPAWRKEQSRPDALITGKPIGSVLSFQEYPALPPLSLHIVPTCFCFLRLRDGHMALGGQLTLIFKPSDYVKQ